MEDTHIDNGYDAPGWRDYRNDPEAIETYKQYYTTVFTGLGIENIHDCSMGSGGATFPLCELGYDVSGSDINENMLK